MLYLTLTRLYCIPAWNVAKNSYSVMHIWDAVFNSYGTILYCITGSSIVLPAGNEAQKSSHLFVLSTHSIPSFLCLSSKTFHRSLNVTCDLQSKIFRLISPSLRFHLQLFVRFDFLFSFFVLFCYRFLYFSVFVACFVWRIVFFFCFTMGCIED